MKQNKILTIVLAILAIHLIYSNTSLLMDLHKMIYEVAELSSWQYLSKFIFAFSYSIITVLIIAIYPKLWIITITGLFDGFAVYLKYNIEQAHFILTGAIYFGLYTMLIVVISGLVSAKILKEAETKQIPPGQKQANDESHITELKKRIKKLTNSINPMRDPTEKAKKQVELEQAKQLLIEYKNR
jgi:hypothetical protein